MKAKDIALLCTAAAGAGAAAGIAAAGANKPAQTKQPKEKPAAKAKKPTETAKKNTNASAEIKPLKATVTELEFPVTDSLSCVYSHSGSGITAVFGSDGKHSVFKARADGSIVSARCPSGISGAAAGDDCVMFLTPRGGVFVYDDPEKEPVLCALTAPEYAAYYDGKFYVFSDSLLYICTSDGEIEKTVSLGAMIEITGGDICDA